MKKLGYLCILTIAIFLSTGCGNKNLSCKLEGKDLGKDLVQHMEVEFDKEEVTKVTNKIETTYEEEYKEEIEVSYQALEESFKQYKKEDGIETKLTKGKDKITVEVTFDMKKQSEASKDISGIDTKATREEIKKDLENQGYVCN